MSLEDQRKSSPAGQHKPGNSGEENVEALCTTGLYCAESVLCAIADDHKIDSPLIPGIATGLCSGMARTCGTCGALTGGILAINMIHGRPTPDQSVEGNYARVKELVNRFAEKYGTTNCAELLGCDLDTGEGQQKFKEQNLAEKCGSYTRQSISFVREILDTEPLDPGSKPGTREEPHE